MEDNKFWRSKAKAFYADTFDNLCQQLNEFAKDKFVIAWQIYTNASFTELHCIVTYKVQE